MAKRRIKTKRTRMAKSRKMTRSRTKKLRKKNKKGGARSRYTGVDRASLPEENQRLRRAALFAKQEADEAAAAEIMADEAYSMFHKTKKKNTPE